jgi:hypothetical protein
MCRDEVREPRMCRDDLLTERTLMSSRILMWPWAIILTLVLRVLAVAEEPLPSLFGFSIGQRLLEKSGLRPINEEETYFIFARRDSKNKEYALQNIGVSKLTNTIVRVFGTAFHKDVGSCRRQEFEIITQLRERYPLLRDKVDEVNGTVHHLLSYERKGCSFMDHVAGMDLRIPCSSSFHVYCQADSNWLFITASDTQYSKLAHDEADHRAGTS